MTNWDDLYYMQDMTSDLCNNAVENASKTLIDKRDGNGYMVTKLKDGNCWMTQNLRLTTSAPLTSSNSDVTANFTLPISSISGFTSSDQNQPKLYYAGDLTNGAYYNWYTATAGTGNASITTDGANAPSSICPKGWQLPINGTTSTDKSYAKLTSGISAGSTLVATPYNFVYGGNVANSSLVAAESGGYYWSSTAYNTASSAYYLHFLSSGVYPSNVDSCYRGYSVRCVAR